MRQTVREKRKRLLAQQKVQCAPVACSAVVRPCDMALVRHILDVAREVPSRPHGDTSCCFTRLGALATVLGKSTQTLRVPCFEIIIHMICKQRSICCSLASLSIQLVWGMCTFVESKNTTIVAWQYMQQCTHSDMQLDTRSCALFGGTPGHVADVVGEAPAPALRLLAQRVHDRRRRRALNERDRPRLGPDPDQPLLHLSPASATCACQTLRRPACLAMLGTSHLRLLRGYLFVCTLAAVFAHLKDSSD